MDLATPQARVLFRGDRLTEARLARGMKKVDIAKALGVTPAAVGQYERGDIRPSADVLVQLAEVLAFPTGFFVTGPASIDLSEDRIHFRRLRSVSSRSKGMQIARLALLEEVVGHLERRIVFPSIAIEQYPLITTDHSKIEAVAESIRRSWGLGDGPITNIVMLIEGVGCVVTRSTADAQGIDAYSRWSGGRPIIVLTSDKQDAARSNFDAAHELGHLVMHPDAEPGARVVEHQAQAFASAFLLPASSIRAELPRRFDIASYVELKRRWRVSIQALLYRARTLEVISEPAFRRAMSRISLWGWRTGEPYSLGPADEPTLLRSALELVSGPGPTDLAFLRDSGIPVDILTTVLPTRRPPSRLVQ
jgi:Zn-dependent peptidase ImmA (M78 family)/transcriptional regulator with XRE-family HTH domain